MKNKSPFIGSIVIMLLSIFSIQTSAQHIMYTYDNNGNRITRHYSPNRIMNDTIPTDAEADLPCRQAGKVAVQYGIGVYPNPLMDGSSVTVAIARNKTTDQTSDNPEEPAPIEASEAIVYVLDNTGKVLFSQKLSVAKSASGGQTTSSPSQIDLSGYAAGIYHIKVAIGKEVLFYKIVKAK